MSILHPTNGPACETDAAAVEAETGSCESAAMLSPGAERRARERVGAARLDVNLRLRGRLTGTRVEALDFNRHGVAIHSAQPIAREKIVFLSLRLAADTRVSVDNLVGVVHNCVRDGDRYRCGIRFRTRSGRQLDRPLVEQLLADVESLLAAGESGETPANR